MVDRNPALRTWQLDGLTSLQRQVLTSTGNSRRLACPPPSFYTFPRMRPVRGKTLQSSGGRSADQDDILRLRAVLLWVEFLKVLKGHLINVVFLHFL